MQISEEIVFDDVVNEVSISSAAEETVKMPSQVGQISNVTYDTSGQTSIGATKPSPVQYFATIKAPTPTKLLPTTSNVSTPNTFARTISFKAVGVSKSTIADKPKTIGDGNSSPSNAKLTPIKVNAIPMSKSMSNSNATLSQSPVVTKLIMTSSGQQLVISSPGKNDRSINTVTPINLVQTGDSQNQQLMAIIPLSPTKTTKSNATTAATPNIRPKPIAIAPSPSLTFTSDHHNKPQQFQMIRLVTTQSPNSSQPIVATIGQANQTAGLKSITANVGGHQKLLIPASALKGLNAGQLIATSTNSSGGQQLIMYTPQIIQQTSTVKNISPSTSVAFTSNATIASSSTSRTSFVPILPSPSTSSAPSERLATSRILSNGTNKSSNEDILSVATAAALSVPPPSRPRKPCNCTRSQCLKLYCDCFANGEFCSNCNCVNCSNNLDHEEERQKAIKLCLERNPHAFHPKIGKGKITAQEGVERRHTKGCNCRRSGCLKNYCECYEAKILCSDLCKCCACKNYEDSYERKTLMHLADAAESRNSQMHGSSNSNAVGMPHSFTGKENEPLWSGDFRLKLPIVGGGGSDRVLPCSFITNQVMNATCKCLLEQMESSRRKHLNDEQTERLLLEEFGRCLVQIIDRANKKDPDQA
jgi:hypothetical protein